MMPEAVNVVVPPLPAIVASPSTLSSSWKDSKAKPLARLALPSCASKSNAPQRDFRFHSHTRLRRRVGLRYLCCLWRERHSNLVDRPRQVQASLGKLILCQRSVSDLKNSSKLAAKLWRAGITTQNEPAAGM